MLSKNEVKYIQSLCHKAKRDEAGLFVAEGPKLATELLSNGFEIEHIYATQKWIEQHPSSNVPLTTITPQELERISQLQTPNQVLIIARQKRQATALSLSSNITLVLDGIQDPGNMGTILRTADWFGIHQIVCSPECADLYNPKVVQATMGSICRVNHWVKPLDTWLQQVQLPVYGAVLSGENVFDTLPPKEALLVIGSEGKGISEKVLSFISRPITIPRIGQAESLNAAVATGILLAYFTTVK